MSIDRPLIAKRHYSRFMRPGRLHFAAHSHHYWPDVTRDAVLACWDDAARLADDKWDHVLGEVLARTQGHIARRLGLGHPANIAFAPNTHELFNRILSCLGENRPVRVLSTTSEFHSFHRQSRRLQEAGLIELDLVATEPLDSFEARFRAQIAAGGAELIYFSQVFFDSGFAVKDLAAMCRAAPDPATVIVIDGYHGFLALPTDLGAVEDRAFYLAGGYKYAMSGEGVCFLHVPKDCRLRPRDTGWFAQFGTLSQAADDGVGYPDDGFRFFGATFDPAGLYRFNAVMDLLDTLGVSTADIHHHVIALQDAFLDALGAIGHPTLNPEALMCAPGETMRGHFLAFRIAGAQALSDRLREQGVSSDARGDILRFGFAPYHDAADIDALIQRLAAD